MEEVLEQGKADSPELQERAGDALSPLQDQYGNTTLENGSSGRVN